MDLIFERCSSDCRQEWDGFAERMGAGSFCHLFAWKEILERAYSLVCRFLVARSSKEIVGLLPLVVVRGPLGERRVVSVPFLDQGGVLSADPDGIVGLKKTALAFAAETQAKGVDFRGPGSENHKLTATDRHRFLLKFGDSEEALWSSIGSKVRNQIRKAEKSGLRTDQVDSAELPRFYSVFARNMRDLGSPVHSLRFFEEMVRELGPRLRLFVTVSNSDKDVAGAVAIRFASTVTVPWASALRSARRDCPNHSLYWAILSSALRDGAREFDFGRSTVGTGTYHFKKQWGAEPQPLVWNSFDPDGRPQEPRLLSAAGNPSIAKLWSHLPLPIANFLGPRIRRRLAN